MPRDDVTKAAVLRTRARERTLGAMSPLASSTRHDASRGAPKALGWLMGIFVALVAFLVVLAIGELVLRVAAPLPYSSRLYWIDDGHVKARLLPDQEPVNTSGQVVQINSLGFRGEEPAWTPSPLSSRNRPFRSS